MNQSDEEEIYPKSKFYLDIMKVILMAILIAVLCVTIYVYEEDAYVCLSDPVGYYEGMANQTCFCSGTRGVRGLNISEFDGSEVKIHE